MLYNNKKDTITTHSLSLDYRHGKAVSIIDGGLAIYRVAPKKVSHYQGSSLNRIKNRQCSYISHQF